MHNSGFLSGIVEGFYGSVWSWSDRSEFVEFLQHCGMNSYVYCPKADSHLRRFWHQNWPQEEVRELANLAAHCSQSSVNFGVGLSPFALYQSYGAEEKAALRRRIGQIDDLGGSLLAILFDDMPGDVADLAERQAEIVADVVSWTNCKRLLVCPTYYSFDPVLERFFGDRPHNYWVSLGKALPAEADIFWTGNEVCSPQIKPADIREISGLLGRAPVLWDNYPVNDGEKASRFLHLSELSGRDELHAGILRGHLCNPMNQPWLSRLGLLGLARLHGHCELQPVDLLGGGLSSLLADDIDHFQGQGLDGMGPEVKRICLEKYAAIDHPGASEVVAWLNEEYRFDPACLTG